MLKRLFPQYFLLHLQRLILIAMSIFKDLKELVAPTGPRPQAKKYYLLPDGYAAAQFEIDGDVFYSIYIGLNHWENKSELPEGSKVHNRDVALKAAGELDEVLKEKILTAISSAGNDKGAGFYVKIKGAVKYDMQYTDEEEFLSQKRELLLQGYKVDDKVTFILDAKEALPAENHRLITDRTWEYSCEYTKRNEAKTKFLQKICNDITHDDSSTQPADRF